MPIQAELITRLPSADINPALRTIQDTIKEGLQGNFQAGQGVGQALRAFVGDIVARQDPAVKAEQEARIAESQVKRRVAENFLNAPETPEFQEIRKQAIDLGLDVRDLYEAHNGMLVPMRNVDAYNALAEGKSRLIARDEARKDLDKLQAKQEKLQERLSLPEEQANRAFLTDSLAVVGQQIEEAKARIQELSVSSRQRSLRASEPAAGPVEAAPQVSPDEIIRKNAFAESVARGEAPAGPVEAAPVAPAPAPAPVAAPAPAPTPAPAPAPAQANIPFPNPVSMDQVLANERVRDANKGATELSLAEQKYRDQQAAEALKAQNLREAISKQKSLVIEDVDRAKKLVNFWTAGNVMQHSGFVPFVGQQAVDLDKLLIGIKANIGFNKLQEMRSNSPTGGALGQVSNKENELLQSVEGSLSQGQSPKQLKENLDRVKANAEEAISIIKRVELAYAAEQTALGKTPASSFDVTTATKPPTQTPQQFKAGDRVRQNGVVYKFNGTEWLPE